MNYKQMYIDQVQLLKSACDDFDNGIQVRVLDIAARLRVICHSTGTSISAIKHIGAEHCEILSCSDIGEGPSPRGCLFRESGLIRPVGSEWVPALDRARVKKLLEFQKWWATDLICISGGYEFTRKRMLLGVANELGGNHLTAAEQLRNRTLHLAEGPWIRPGPGGRPSRITNHQYPYIRQIAWELMESESLKKYVETL